ncbi:hypothetical protein XENOCAPTIV_027562 [Xenoophorus captivus]|uniref:TSG101 and ALIX binding domain-containing protein n=1 Tax=Xenoophorus captivus TaxID=1517983 RepID=A0ABV0QG03_9TELE
MDSASISSEGDALLREKTRSFGVLNTLYHETRGEMELLNKQIYLKDNIIADLKTRLARHERIYMTVGDDEPVVIGPANSLVESLLTEICKLKQKRSDMDLKAARQAEEIQRLNAQIREKELELERIRCQPDHEKDQEIQRLRAALEEREQAAATRTVLCSSLAEEADQLRGQLGATVKVQDLNSQWQKYDTSREEYIRALCQRLKESSGQGLSLVMLHQEISRLNSLLEEKIRECARLDRDMEDIRRQSHERIQTLEQQVGFHILLNYIKTRPIQYV